MRSSIVLLAAFIPSFAYASGNDVLSLFWLESIALLVVVATLLASRLRAAGNLLVLLAYAAGAAIPLYLTRNWPYSEDIYLINTLCTAIPLAIFAASYWMVRRKYGKSNGSLRARRP